MAGAARVATRLVALPAVGLRVGRAGPRAAPGRRPAARGARPRAAAGDVRRLAAPRRAADARAGAAPPRALPATCASSSTRPSDWTPELIAELAATGARRLGRLQGPVRGHGRRPGAPTRRSTAGWSRRSRDAWIEDPRLTPRPMPILEPHRDRITWDANIHSVADIEGLPFPPRMVNIKPSRLGPLRELMRAYDYCAERGIGDVRRRPVRARARAAGRSSTSRRCSTPTRPTTSRRAATTRSTRPAGLPASPLAPEPSAIGFRWGEWNDR